MRKASKPKPGSSRPGAADARSFGLTHALLKESTLGDHIVIVCLLHLRRRPLHMHEETDAEDSAAAASAPGR